MARKVFYSFHYIPDAWRAAQVRNAGVVEGNQPVSDNDWETIKSSGDAAIARWIGGQMQGKSCAVVLIGSQTATRKWVRYEIEKAWADGRGVVGVYVHGLKDAAGRQATRGSSPFYGLTVGGVSLYSVVEAHDPPYTTSDYVYGHIKDNLEGWVDRAVEIRKKY